MTMREWSDPPPNLCRRCGAACEDPYRVICVGCYDRKHRRFVAALGDILAAWPDLPIRAAKVLARAVDSAAAARALSDEALLAIPDCGPVWLAAFRARVPRPDRPHERADWREHADMLAGVPA
jgi:hypothetical protein